MQKLITQENIDQIYAIIVNHNGIFSSSEISDYIETYDDSLSFVTQEILNLLLSENKIFLKSGKYFCNEAINNTANYNLKLLDLSAIIKSLKTINLNISENTKYRLSQPINAYKKFTLPNLSFKNPLLKDKIFQYLNFSGSGMYETANFVDINKNVNKIIDMIKLSNSEGTFPNLTIKECKYLFLSRDFLLDEKYKNLRIQFYNYLENLENIKSRLFRAVLYAYFKLYYQLSIDTSFIQLLNSTSNKYFEHNKYITKSLRNLKDDNITSQDYCSKIAKKVLKDISLSNVSIKESLANHNSLIAQDMDIFYEIMKELGVNCLKNIEDNFYLDLLLDILNVNFQKSQMDKLLSAVIMHIFSNSKKNIDIQTRKKIQLSILNNPNYGDPRLNPQKWYNIEKAKQLFLSWLAKEDLEFFFNIMFRNSVDLHNRKTFWEQYINSEELLYSKVILSNVAASDPAVKKLEAEGRKFAKFSNSSDGSSCFILAFKTAYIVEFSEVGNALYFYDIDTPDIRMDQLKYSSIAALKKTNTLESTKTNLINPDIKEIKRFRVRHIDGWQLKVKDILSRNLRIYPGG